LNCSTLPDFSVLWSLLTSHSSLLLQISPPVVRPHGISRQSFLVYLPNLLAWVTIAFWTSPLLASLSAMQALVSGFCSSATTPLVDFHHRLTACPSYQKNGRPKSAVPPYKTQQALVGSLLSVARFILQYYYRKLMDGNSIYTKCISAKNLRVYICFCSLYYSATVWTYNLSSKCLYL
jgi:hypothetical protein